MLMIERIVSGLVGGCCHLVELERRLTPYRAGLPLLNTLLSSSADAVTKVDEFVKQFVLDLEAHQRSGRPNLEYVDEIKWAADEIVFHLKCINRFLVLVENEESQALQKIVQQAILETEALLGAVLVCSDLRSSIEAEVRTFDS